MKFYVCNMILPKCIHTQSQTIIIYTLECGYLLLHTTGYYILSSTSVCLYLDIVKSKTIGIFITLSLILNCYFYNICINGDDPYDHFMCCFTYSENCFNAFRFISICSSRPPVFLTIMIDMR